VTTDKDIQARLETIRLVYDKIQQIRDRWDDLQTVETARADYESLIAKEFSELGKLKKAKVEWQTKLRRQEMPRSEFKPWETEFRPRGPIPPLPPPPPPPNEETILATRRRFKKFFNRYAHSLHLNTGVLGKINCIAEDIDRPLGEALALLEWHVFQVRTRRESNEDYLVRLAEWDEALVKYHAWLAGEIDTLETRFRRWMNIWELWRERDVGDKSKAQWETFIDETRRALREEIACLQEEITYLETHLYETGERL